MTSRFLLLVGLALLALPDAALAARRVSASGPIDRQLLNDPDFEWCPSNSVYPGVFLADGTDVTIVFRARNFGPIPLGAEEGAQTRGNTVWLHHVLDNISVLDFATYLSFFSPNADCFDCGEGEGYLLWDQVDPQAYTLLDDFLDPFLPPGWEPDSGAYLHTAQTPEMQSASNDLSDSLNCVGEHSGFAMGLGDFFDPDSIVSTHITLPDVVVHGEEYVLNYWWMSVADADPGNGDLWVEVYGEDPWQDATDPDAGTASNTWSAAWGDYDNDQDPDLYLARSFGFATKNQLLRNDGGGQFADVTPPALDDPGDASGATWADIDGDGDLDLFLLNYDDSANPMWMNDNGNFIQMANFSFGTTAVAASWADQDLDGDLDVYVTRAAGANSLLRNDGSFNFVTVTPTPLEGGASSQGAAWADYDGDGDPDLYLVEWTQPNELYRNDGGSFANVAAAAGVDDAGPGNGCAWGDHDNDGDLDLFVANYNAANLLYRNDDGTFVNVASGPMTDPALSYAGSWADTDLDGDLDLFCAQALETNSLYCNDGPGGFAEAIGGPFPITENRLCVGGVLADADSDGDPDLFVTNQGAEGDQLFCADLDPGNHWLKVDLKGNVSNSFGIGARIELTTGGVTQTREVSASSSWYSQNPSTAMFGVGPQTTIDELIVRWPSGIIQRILNVAVDTHLIVAEDGVTEVSPLPASTGPAAFALHPVAPNPFSGRTTIRFDVPVKSRVSLEVFDVSGRLVRTLEKGWMDAGRKGVTWDGRNASGRTTGAGVYFVRLEADDFRATRKVLRLDRR